jgi:ATP-dependent RNA helicase DeaD
VVDQDEREPAPTVARNSNVIYTLPHDHAAMTQIVTVPLERVDEGQAATQLLVIAPDVETAVALAGTAVRLAGDRGLDIVPVTSARRGARLLAERPAHVVVGTPAELLALLQRATLKLDTLRAVVLAWADELIEVGATESLETIMAETPKEAARIVVAAAMTPGVEALIERYARRGRRVGETPGTEASEARALRYVGTPLGSRAVALRRLLDQLDPGTASVFVRSEASEDEATHALRSLGYRASDAVRVTRGAAAENAGIVVLYDLPANRIELQGIVGAAPRAMVVALAQPRQIPTLRALSGGAPVSALALPGVADAARAHDERMRAELRAALAEEPPTRELIALEPLLEEFDGVELAAAAFRLLERERARFERKVGETPSAPADAQWKRVFINVGSKDGVRAGDLVGAIAGEAGITSAQIGKIEVRETHALVEIAAPEAETVAAKLSGREIRGRRVVSRVDTDRPPREGSDRPPRGDRPARGDRPPRADRGGDRGERGPRGGSFGARDRGERPARGGGGRFERSDRGERGGREGARRPPRTRE